MRRLEQRGAVAFAVVIFIALVIAVWGAVLEDDDAPLARLLGQPKLLHLRAHLVHVPAKEARRLCNRPAVVEFVLEVRTNRYVGSLERGQAGISGGVGRGWNGRTQNGAASRCQASIRTSSESIAEACPRIASQILSSRDAASADVLVRTVTYYSDGDRHKFLRPIKLRADRYETLASTGRRR